LACLANDPRCNPSGGGGAGYCAPAMGLARVVEAVLQLQGRAGAVQIPGARRALATGSSVVAAQTHTAIVLEAA
jgi:acetyl-CoA acyltransferase